MRLLPHRLLSRPEEKPTEVVLLIEEILEPAKLQSIRRTALTVAVLSLHEPGGFVWLETAYPQ